MKSLNRKDIILKLIVEDFIKTATPVGSSTLMEEYKLPYSSATIRNEMAELEKQGYIEKTHTSSGRVPSAKGYRYYVDNLREDNKDASIKHQIQSLFEINRGISIDEAIKQSCEIISSLTNLTSVVLGPNADKEKLSKISLVPIDNNSAVAIFVTDSGHVEHKTFSIPPKVSFEDLNTAVNILNDRVAGTPISKVVEKVESIKPILAERIENSEEIFRAFLEAFLRFTYERVSVFGRENLFEYQEFTNDIEKLKKFISMLDNNTIWNNLSSSDGVRVCIGSENTITDLDDMSIVTADIKLHNNQKGTIALLGPTRMDYSRVMNAIEMVQEQIDEFFKESEEE